MPTYLDPDESKLIPEVDPNDQPWCPSWGCGGRLGPADGFPAYCAIILCSQPITWECTKCMWTYCGEHALDTPIQTLKGT